MEPDDAAPLDASLRPIHLFSIGICRCDRSRSDPVDATAETVATAGGSLQDHLGLVDQKGNIPHSSGFRAVKSSIIFPAASRPPDPNSRGNQAPSLPGSSGGRGGYHCASGSSCRKSSRINRSSKWIRILGLVGRFYQRFRSLRCYFPASSSRLTRSAANCCKIFRPFWVLIHPIIGVLFLFIT